MQRLWNWARILSTGAPAPGSTVTIYNSGTVVLSTIFSDNISTPKANPFTADATTGYWFFYAAAGRYDVKFSGTGITSPYTLSDVTLFDPTDGFIQSLNAQSQAAQTLVVGTAGTDFAVVSAAGVHTLNLPNAGAVARGVVSTGAQTIAGAKTFSTPIAAGSGGTGFDGSAAANGRVPIGNGAGFTLANLLGTANQVIVTNGAGSITLSSPQNLNTGANPTFSTVTLSDFAGLGSLIPVFDNAGTLLGFPGTLAGGILIAGGSQWTPGTITPGTGISVTNAPASITLANTGILSLASPAGAAITGALTLAVGSAGTDVAISPTTVGATTITLNVPSASATARGVLTTTSQTLGGTKTFNSPPLIIPGTAVSSTTPGRPVVAFLRTMTPATNTGAGEDDLQTVSLPANTLDTDFSSALRITAWGTCAANANTKTIKLYFGATIILTLSNATTFNNTHWRIEAIVARTGASNQEVIAQGFVSVANTVTPVGTTVLQTNPAIALGSAVTIKTTGEAVATNDIIAKALLVEVLY